LEALGINRAVCLGAVDAANNNGAAAIICITKSGETCPEIGQK
jgi:hypothetical protein